MDDHLASMAMQEQADEMEALKARLAQLETAATKLAEGRLLTSKEVALVLGAHHKTIEKWTRAKGNPLPCVRRGRTPRFRLGDVNRWVVQQKEG
jgi:excisionase family DNA binding protein